MFPFLGPLASPSGSTLSTQEFKQILSDSPVPQNAPAWLPTPTTSTPTPTNEVLTFSTQDWTADVERSGERQTDPVAPCGILKQSSATGSMDHDWTGPVSPSSSAETWTDRKQVRFSPEVTRRRTKLQRGKELGEHSVLDVDTITPPLADNNSDQESSIVTTDNPFLIRRLLDAQDVDTITPPLVDNDGDQESSTVTTDNPFLSQRPLDAQDVDAMTTSLVDFRSDLENCNVSTNPFLSQGPLDTHEVELTFEKEEQLQEQEISLSQIYDGKTCEKLIKFSETIIKQYWHFINSIGLVKNCLHEVQL